MKQLFIYRILVCCLFTCTILCVSSCKDVNDWSVDDRYNKAFTPVLFSLQDRDANTATVKFSVVPYVAGYIIEVSEDDSELLFNNITQTIEVTREDVKIDPLASNVVYLYTVTDLISGTDYSMRLKAISNSGGADSDWRELTVQTSSEQIMNAVTDITENSALLSWTPGADVGYIFYGIVDDNGSTKDIKKIELTEEEIASGTYLLRDLAPNTMYQVSVSYLVSDTDSKYIARGTRTFRTKSDVPADGYLYTLEGMEDLNELIQELALEDTRITLVFPAGSEYLMERVLTIPGNLSSLTLWGLPGDLPKLRVPEIKLSGNNEFEFKLHGIEVSGTSMESDFLFNIALSNSIVFPKITIEESICSNMRGLVRLRNDAIIKDLVIENSIIYDLGGYGVFNGEGNSLIEEMNVRNSTFYNFVGGFARYQNTNSIKIEHCTFFNAIQNGNYLLRFNTTLARVIEVHNSIFAHPSADAAIRGTSTKIDTEYVFNSYHTNDFTINTGFPFTGIQPYNKSSYELFNDPDNGDLTIIDESIDLNHEVGDPRWWLNF